MKAIASSFTLTMNKDTVFAKISTFYCLYEFKRGDV